MPTTFENFLEKNFTDSDPMRPPDPVIITIDIVVLCKLIPIILKINILY
tara:strand:+ start:44 stop:190 length:147 start_codon:yes stop_codon:yes gene_type:complete